MRPARDECGGVSRQFGAEQDVSEGTDWRSHRTEKWKNRCVHIQNESKDTHGDNSNIKGNESVTAIQNLQSLSLGKFHVGITHKN